MAPRKQKITPFPPWQTKSFEGREQSYIRLGASQLKDESMLSLTSGAFQTYVYMLNASKGKREFIFPKNQYTKLCGTEAFIRQKKELIQKGFIKISENGNNIVGKATLYAFSDEWKNTQNKGTFKHEKEMPRAP